MPQSFHWQRFDSHILPSTSKGLFVSGGRTMNIWTIWPSFKLNEVKMSPSGLACEQTVLTAAPLWHPETPHVKQVSS